MALIVVTGVGGIHDLEAGLGYASIDSTWRIAYPDGADCTLWGRLGVYPDVSGRYVYFNLFDLPRPEVYFIFSGAHLTGAAGGIDSLEFGDTVVIPTLGSLPEGEDYSAFGTHIIRDAARTDLYFNFLELPYPTVPLQLVWGAFLIPLAGSDYSAFGVATVTKPDQISPVGIYREPIIPTILVRRYRPIYFNLLEC